MDGSADGLPLLSQDEFFRHLNLQSVHASSAKYHYRQALKERLRASKVAVNGVNGISVGKSINKNNNTTKAPNGIILPLLNGNSERSEILTRYYIIDNFYFWLIIVKNNIFNIFSLSASYLDLTSFIL